ncbi:MAG: DUF11 domain-containing protein [Propionibacteriaceae bacterium]|nr:DUF11 domain-containing protein [Propionibacteriaceae bacterium]
MNNTSVHPWKITIARIALVLSIALLVSIVGFGPSSAWADPAFTATKTAQVINGVSGEGTADSPIPVNIGDQIEYTITVTHPAIPEPNPKYDVLFVLDWSLSMNAGYDGGQAGTSTSNDWWAARNRAKSTLTTLSQQIFTDYPGSRIALMGLNANDRNTAKTGNTYIQVNTDFVGPDQYSSVIQNAFTQYPAQTFDDISVFMQAGIDKLHGENNQYGGLTAWGTTAPTSWTQGRTDQTRIPVMVVISDFEIGMGNFGSSATGPTTGGNWATVTAQATRFKSLFSNGILLAVRADSQENTNFYKGIFATPAHDAKMNESFITAGGTTNGQNNWGWVKFEANQTQAYQDSLLYNLIKAKAPPPPFAVTVTDLLPEGLQYLSSTPAGTSTVVGGRAQVVWTTWDRPAGTFVYKVRAKVGEYGTFVNTATVAVATMGSVTTNPTYHKATNYSTLTATKTAKVNGGATANGTAANPIAVTDGDIIDYTITVKRPTPTTATPRYDVLFVLDWSASMNAGYNTGQNNTAGNDPLSARNRAKATIKAVSEQIFQDYPDSRVALMGFSAGTRNSMQMSETHIQADTDFLDSAHWNNGVPFETAFASPRTPSYDYDDISVFMRAANFKLNGTAQAFGTGAVTGGTVPKQTVVARTDKTRIPIMIVISDFEIGMSSFPTPQTAAGAWSTVNSQAISSTGFKGLFSQGILLAVRTDTNQNTITYPAFSSAEHDAHMNASFTSVDPTTYEDHYGWIKFEKDQTQEYQNTLLYNLLKSKAGPSAIFPTTTTDLLPAGLQYVSSNLGGTKTTVDGRDQVVWTNPNLPVGNTVYTVKAKVVDPGTYVNTATVVDRDGSATTNATYHDYPPPITEMTLHIRQIVINRSGSTPELPTMGYMTLSNAGIVRNITTNSGIDGGPPTDFTQYLVTTSLDDSIFLITDIVPQYYSYAGYNATTTDVPHDPVARLIGSIGLDFDDGHEYWVTVYISPQSVPADYSWDVRTNDFGTIAGPVN